VVTYSRLCFWKVWVQHRNSICLLGYTPGWGATRSMSLRLLTSQTLAAKSTKLRIKFLWMSIGDKVVDALEPISHIVWSIWGFICPTNSVCHDPAGSCNWQFNF
jgi:hypothetical protein